MEKEASWHYQRTLCGSLCTVSSGIVKSLHCRHRDHVGHHQLWCHPASSTSGGPEQKVLSCPTCLLKDEREGGGGERKRVHNLTAHKCHQHMYISQYQWCMYCRMANITHTCNVYTVIYKYIQASHPSDKWLASKHKWQCDFWGLLSSVSSKHKYINVHN